MKLKKTLSLVLALIMVAATFGAIAIPAAADTVTASATGTADTSWYTADPNATTFTLMDADDLDGLAKLVNEGTCNFVGKTVKLGADIVYNNGKFTVAEDGAPLYNGQPVSETNAPRVWPIIGVTFEGNRGYQNIEQFTGGFLPDMTMFRGNFDGEGHAISGLFVNTTETKSLGAIGLFSNFRGEELKNTMILNSYFHGGGNVGSFAGFIQHNPGGPEDLEHDVTLENLYSDAYIVTDAINDSRSGGIVGQIFKINSFYVNRCSFEGHILHAGTGNARHTGGLFGMMNHIFGTNDSITNCLVNATFSVVGPAQKVEYWGGVIGNLGGDTNCTTKIENTLVIIDTTNIPLNESTENPDGNLPFARCGSFVGVHWYLGTFEVTNSYCILKSDKFTNTTWMYRAGLKTIVNGVETSYEAAGNSVELGTKITAPSEATGLSSETFLLTAEKAAIKDLSACFDGHSFTELYQAKTASCEGEGWNAHYRCNNCSKFFDTSTNEVAKDTVILPETHNYGTLVTGTPATCTENGTIDHYKCSLCNRLFDKDKNKVTDLTILAGHNYGELIRRVKATCVEPGTIAHYQCSVCSKYFDEDKAEVADITIPVTDHDYGRWNEAVAPTLNAAGVLGHYRCGECRKYFDADKNELASIEGEPKLTTTKKPDTTKAPTTTAAEEKGCGGFAAVGSLLALIALTGAAVVIKKK